MTWTDFELFAEEQSQWATAHELEAILEEVFELYVMDLGTFGVDLNLPPAPHGMVAS